MASRPQVPLGPRSKTSRPFPHLPLPSGDSSHLPDSQNISGNHSFNALSPSDTPRFNIPAPILGKPIPRPKTGDKPSLGKLAINGGVGFAHIAGPPRVDDVDDGSSTLSPQPPTIRPPESYDVSSHHDRSVRPVDPGASQNGYGYSNGNGSDAVGDLRDALGKIALSSLPAHPPPASESSPSSTSNRPTSESTERPKPTEFSDNVLEEIVRLGEGAGGAVHKVRDRRDGHLYARKTITTREVAMKQVVRELNIISTTQHRNIVQCFGAYMSPSSSEVKIVMECCDGGSLEAIGKKIKEINAVVGEKIAGRLAEGVLQGLAYLHSKKTIHRDIKPSNILLSREGIVKLSDFGVSGELVESIVGTFTGTLIYMAPERVSGGKYTVRSDVWSTGISLLELVQNRFPFTFDSDVPAFEVILTISKGQPPRLEDDPDAGITWSDEMKDFIKQALTVDPSMRPTPREMLDHPWIISMLKQEVHMARWIRQVWGWPKPLRKSDSSRPATAGEDSAQESPGSINGPSGA